MCVDTDKEEKTKDTTCWRLLALMLGMGILLLHQLFHGKVKVKIQCCIITARSNRQYVKSQQSKNWQVTGIGLKLKPQKRSLKFDRSGFLLE